MTTVASKTYRAIWDVMWGVWSDLKRRGIDVRFEDNLRYDMTIMIAVALERKIEDGIAK